MKRETALEVVNNLVIDAKGREAKPQKQVKTKKQVVIGKETYVNERTGEVQEFTVIQKNVGADFNFHKIWLQDLLNVLNSFGNCKIKVLSYMLGKMRNEDNTVSLVYQKAAEDCKISRQTVGNCIKALIESGILRKVQNGLWQFNPDVIIKGSGTKRQRLLIEYNIEEKRQLDLPFE